MAEFFVHRIDDGRRILQGAYVDNEVIVMTEDGRYDTSYEGSQSIQLRFAGIPVLFTFRQFDAMLRRPGLAKAVLEGQAVIDRLAILPTPPTAQLTIFSALKNDRRSGKIVANSSREVSAIRVYIDGRMVREIPVSGQRVDVPIDLPDPGGGRWISAVAVDAQGLVSLPSAIQLPGPPRPRGMAHVIAVGVDTYTDPNIETLNSTKIDAE